MEIMEDQTGEKKYIFKCGGVTACFKSVLKVTLFFPLLWIKTSFLNVKLVFSLFFGLKFKTRRN